MGSRQLRQGTRLGAQSQDMAAQNDHNDVRRVLYIIDPEAPVSVDPNQITVDSAIQVRIGGLNEERVERLMQVLLNGGAFEDPIDLFQDGLILADGLHRREAYLRALADPGVVSGEIALAPLMANFHPGGFDEALEFAEEANLRHGEPLTTDDLKNLLYRRLERGYYGVDVSNRQIAQTLGVAHTTIGRWRLEWQHRTGAHAPVREHREKKIVTKSGQTMRVDGIAAANKKRAKQGPTATQIKRAVVKHLEDAAGGLERLGMSDHADGLLDYARERREEWGL